MINADTIKGGVSIDYNDMLTPPFFPASKLYKILTSNVTPTHALLNIISMKRLYSIQHISCILYPNRKWKDVTTNKVADATIVKG